MRERGIEERKDSGVCLIPFCCSVEERCLAGV